MKPAKSCLPCQINSGADVIAALETLAEGSPRRDMISAVNRAAAILNISTSELPVSAFTLRLRFARIHPVQENVSAKRLSNIKSDLKRAIERAKTIGQRNRRPQPLVLPKELPSPGKFALTPGWQAVQSELQPKWRAWQLSRFMRYCSREHLLPTQIGDDVLQRFWQELRDTDLAKDPDRTAILTIGAWNGYVDLSRQDLPRLAAPAPQGPRTLPIDAYPSSFGDDLERYLHRLSVRLDLNALELEELIRLPPKPLKPVTIRNIRSSVRKACHALVQRGVPAESIVGLDVLVTRENFLAVLRHYWARDPERKPTWLAGLAADLLAIAKHHTRIDDKSIEELKALKRKITIEPVGLTPTNRRRLAQFDNEENVVRLIALPARLMAAAERSMRSSRTALKAMLAVAIGLLLAVPMRVKNLSSLHIDRNLIWGGPVRRRTLCLFIPAEEVKNHTAIEADLPPETVRLIERYLKEWLPLLGRGGHGWLFPNRAGHRSPEHLSAAIGKAVFGETGIEMSAHSFRHFAGKMILDAYPGRIDLASQLLHHRKQETTTRFYTGYQNKRALAVYDREVLAPRRRKRGAPS